MATMNEWQENDVEWQRQRDESLKTRDERVNEEHAQHEEDEHSRPTMIAVVDNVTNFFRLWFCSEWQLNWSLLSTNFVQFNCEKSLLVSVAFLVHFSVAFSLGHCICSILTPMMNFYLWNRRQFVFWHLTNFLFIRSCFGRSSCARCRLIEIDCILYIFCWIKERQNNWFDSLPLNAGLAFNWVSADDVGRLHRFTEATALHIRERNSNTQSNHVKD